MLKNKNECVFGFIVGVSTIVFLSIFKLYVVGFLLIALTIFVAIIKTNAR